MIQRSGGRNWRAVFVFSAAPPGVQLGKVEVEECERGGEEALERFALADGELRVGLRRRPGGPHKGATEEESDILEQE